MTRAQVACRLPPPRAVKRRSLYNTSRGYIVSSATSCIYVWLVRSEESLGYVIFVCRSVSSYSWLLSVRKRDCMEGKRFTNPDARNIHQMVMVITQACSSPPSLMESRDTHGAFRGPRGKLPTLFNPPHPYTGCPFLTFTYCDSCPRVHVS